MLPEKGADRFPEGTNVNSHGCSLVVVNINPMTLIAAVLVLSKAAQQRACPAARAWCANAARRRKSRNPFGRGVVRPSATLPLIADGLTSPLRVALWKRRTTPRQRKCIYVHGHLTKPVALECAGPRIPTFRDSGDCAFNSKAMSSHRTPENVVSEIRRLRLGCAS